MKIEIGMIVAGLVMTGALIGLENGEMNGNVADTQAATTPAIKRGAELMGPAQPYVPGSFTVAAAAKGALDGTDSKARSGPKHTADGTLLLTFEDLACYTYEHPDPRETKQGAERPKQIPDEIAGLKGKVVTVEGHMVPVSVKQGKVTLFILSRYLDGCCFGQPAMMNEWVDVEMVGEGAEYIPYGTILCTGTLDVGEQLDEYGYVRSIYRMKCTKVQEADK